MDLDFADDAVIFASEINVWSENVDIDRFTDLGCDIRSSVVVLLIRLTNICAGLMDINGVVESLNKGEQVRSFGVVGMTLCQMNYCLMKPK